MGRTSEDDVPSSSEPVGQDTSTNKGSRVSPISGMFDLGPIGEEKKDIHTEYDFDAFFASPVVSLDQQDEEGHADDEGEPSFVQSPSTRHDDEPVIPGAFEDYESDDPFASESSEVAW
jgi:hypothetical protein